MIAQLMIGIFLVSVCGGVRSNSTTRSGRCKTDRQCSTKNVCTRCDTASGRCVQITDCCNEKTMCKRDNCLMTIGLSGVCSAFAATGDRPSNFVPKVGNAHDIHTARSTPTVVTKPSSV